MLLTIISFLLVLTVLVLVHEVGHYLVAKWFGIKVEEFGFGFPPRAWGKKIGETIYSINWLPIGGFVKLFGEDEAGGGKVQVSTKEEIQQGDLQRAFFAHPVWQRALIVFAGVAMNFILAAALLSYLVGFQGLPTPGQQVIIAGIAKDSPLTNQKLQYQVRAGDRITTISTLVSPQNANSHEIEKMNVTSVEQVISYVKARLGKELILYIDSSKGTKEENKVVPRIHYPSNEGPIGIALTSNIIVKKYPWYLVPFIGIREACIESWQIIAGLGQLIFQLIFHGSLPEGLAGPVGIAQITGQFVQLGVNATLSLLALLSLNLAVLNVIPFPALDGGRLFFILLEGFTGKKVSPKIEGYVHSVGMILLLTLLAIITFHDIVRIATGGSLLPK